MLPLGLVALVAVSSFGTLAASATSTFAESLAIRPLADGKVDAFFLFTINATSVEGAPSHETLAPSSLFAILQSHQADSFELSLTAGTWQHARWGYPQSETGGSGAEVWAVMGHAPDPDDRHQALAHALSGLFCASLGQSLTNTFTTRPYIPHLVSAIEPLPYHTTSPPSGLCTENLTPFLKLLPSKGKSGLSGLLKSHRVLAGHWSSMKVRVWRAAGARDDVRMALSFEVVWDLVGRKQGANVRDLSIEKLFKTAMPRPFPPAQSSTLNLVLPDEDDRASRWSLRSSSERATDGRTVTWDLKADPEFDFGLSYGASGPFIFPRSYEALPLIARRTVLGADQTEGAFELVIANNAPSPSEVVLMEEWPWWIGGWMSERQITVDGRERDDIVHSISYEPSIPHERPTTLLSHLVLPANSTTRILAPFLKQFLEYGEHPPDASRGFELCAAILFPLDPALPRRIHTANVLVDLPTPDFSMPYNVIIMTSTLLALFFGSIFNILTRRLVALKVDEPERPQVPVGNTADAAAEEPVPASAQ